jgi:magnesium-protoporphyrin O-methyltransferase
MSILTPVRYEKRRTELEQYFDCTAIEAWEKLTSDAPVSGIRATVRAVSRSNALPTSQSFTA